MLYDLLNKHNAEFFLQYGSGKDANFYYSTSFKIPDAALYIIGSDGTDLLVVSEMEKNRAEKESKVKEIASLADLGYYENLKELKDSKKALAITYVNLLKGHKARKILIPPNFPSFLAFHLQNYFEVVIVDNPFSKLRMVKRKDEIEKIKDVGNAIVQAFGYFMKILRQHSKCEELRNEVELFLFKNGYLAEDTIISSGEESANPHSIGFGEIKDHVIFDVFPKSRTHGYYSDFTRTVIVNENKEIEEMLDAVVEAQEKAISMIRDGVMAKDVHNAVCDILESKGYHTIRKKFKEGFIHSTGHGIGLEVHEEPRIFENDEVLKAGMVVTVEPGLYYKRIGGVRVEDTVVVRKNGCEILTPYKKKIKLEA
ncbi:aminopeptidase P family protein [Archaeoglobales archaeon]|nr:MAG: aminopeptidase P family protein [Archaeoglobales archaeon]